MTTLTTASDLLLGLAARGVTVEAAGDRLRFHPRAAVTVDDMAVLREHKGVILRLLADGVFQLGYTGYGYETAQNTGNTGVLLPLVPQDSPGDNYEFEERAAIHEFDAGLPRPEAERLALVAGGGGDGDHGDAAPVIESPTLPEAGDWQEVIEADGRRIWQRAEMAGLEAADFPTPCPKCGGIVFWWDLRNGQHCERCEPRTTGSRLRELAQRLRGRYGLPADDDHGQNLVEQRRGRTWPPRVADDIAADPCPACSGCGGRVIPGQPGRTAGLCFRCWLLKKGRFDD